MRKEVITTTDEPYDRAGGLGGIFVLFYFLAT